MASCPSLQRMRTSQAFARVISSGTNFSTILQLAGRRPSCPLAHSPACTEVSAVGPSKRLTRMAGRPSLITATRCRIEIAPSVGLYLSRSCAPPASPPEASAIVDPARALYWSTHACSTSIASFRPDSAMPLLLLDLEAIEDHVRPSRFEQPGPRLSGDIAIDDLREVRRQPGGVVTRVVPPARVVRRATVDHAQQGYASFSRGRQCIRPEVGRGENETHVGGHRGAPRLDGIDHVPLDLAGLV